MTKKLITKKLILIYGANGTGKTITARNLATKYSGLHISMDMFSAMFRGKIWHTRKCSTDKMKLIISVLEAAIKETNYSFFLVDGVLTYSFMFKLLENWCLKNNITFQSVKLIGNLEESKLRIISRNKHTVNWNNLLPDFYSKYSYKNSLTINVDERSTEYISEQITSNFSSSHKINFGGIAFFSLGILKPDCIQRKLDQEAFRRISNAGFEIVISKKITLNENDVQHIYSHCIEKPFFNRMKQFLTSSECIVFIVKRESKDAIKKLNSLVGFTDPSKAKFGTLRELGKSITSNIAHSSDSSENFIKESEHFFSKYELIQAGLNIDYY